MVRVCCFQREKNKRQGILCSGVHPNAFSEVCSMQQITIVPGAQPVELLAISTSIASAPNALGITPTRERERREMAEVSDSSTERCPPGSTERVSFVCVEFFKS